jgi:hypothetical protein
LGLENITGKSLLVNAKAKGKLVVLTELTSFLSLSSNATAVPLLPGKSENLAHSHLSLVNSQQRLRQQNLLVIV